MLNARLYRAALLPVVLALAIGAFSLGGRPAPLTSTLTSDAYEGAHAFADMRALATQFPETQAGSVGDERLARYVAQAIEGFGGFSVRLQRFEGRTASGEHALVNVVAQRPGSTDESPIVILAHRDTAPTPKAMAGAPGALSGTATLLELARVFATRATKRTIVLVSTDGGASGGAGAAQLLAAGGAIATRAPVDGAIVLGDLAAARPRHPLVIPYGSSYGFAPLQLQRTVAEAIAKGTGANPGAPSAFGQLAHLAFPLAVGEQAPLVAAGVPAVLVQAAGEGGSTAAEPVSAESMETLGRGVLSAVDALDASPDLVQARQTALVLQGKTLPSWAVSLLALTLLLAAAAAAVDGLARARRRRLPIGASVLWALSFGLPFLACALLAYVLGALGIVDATASPAPPAATPFDAAAATALAAVLLTFALAWLLWGRLIRRLGAHCPSDPDVVALAVVLVLVPIGLIAWIADPYTALLVVPAAHLLLLVSGAELRLGRLGALALVALGLLPLAALCAFYADQLSLGPSAAAYTALLVVAGGQLGLASALLWSAALGAIVAAARVAVVGWRRPPRLVPVPTPEITIRGPLTYAGPGSLGGTESALRR